MRIGVLGSGVVGRTIGTKLSALGHDVVMGSREAGSPAGREWAEATGGSSRSQSFADAAAFGDVLFNATLGVAALEALAMAGADNLGTKVLLDLTNPLDFSNGFPPSLSIPPSGSLGEEIQLAYPAVRVVKGFNTMSAGVMVEPGALAGPHDVFICGNDAAAKETVTGIMGEMGWPRERVVDLGDITSSRGMEAYVLFWIRVAMKESMAPFNISIVRA
jgi:predicted dinucleotide-binding enzyme